MRNVFAKALALLPFAAAAMTYPPYELYTGTTSGSPQLNYTKVCDPGRTGEASASYVTMGSLYPARPALVNTAYAGKVTIPAYIGGLPVRRMHRNGAQCSKIKQLSVRSLPGARSGRDSESGTGFASSWARGKRRKAFFEDNPKNPHLGE
jgi:hypothetical protein